MLTSESHSCLLGLGLLQPLVNSVRTVFQTMLFMEPAAASVQQMPGGQTTYALSAIVQLTGSFNATVAISFEEGTALGLAASLSGEPQTAVNPTVIDAIGELGNLIVGSAKPRFSKAMKMCLPKVITGQVTVTRGPRLIVPYSVAAGAFTLEIGQ